MYGFAYTIYAADCQTVANIPKTRVNWAFQSTFTRGTGVAKGFTRHDHRTETHQPRD